MMMTWELGLFDFLLLAATLFVIGICGIFINRNNVINILMSIELMLLAVNINFMAFSASAGNNTGQIFVIFILTVAAAEAAIGLAILVSYYRHKNDINVAGISQLKG